MSSPNFLVLIFCDLKASACGGLDDIENPISHTSNQEKIDSLRDMNYTHITLIINVII